jgi:hypothetical protein
MFDVTYGHNLFVAVSDPGNSIGRIMTSPDGNIWTSFPTIHNDVFKSVTFGSGLFMTVGQGGWSRRSSNGIGIGAFTPLAMSSPDGTNWTTRSIDGGSVITYGNGIFVVTTGGCRVFLHVEN